MLPWFPVVGLLLGLVWAAFDLAIGYVFPLPVRGALTVFFLVFLTGGLHLDGLADTFDGLLSHRSRQAALQIMKDSRVGTWGLVSVVAVLGLKAAALWDINGGGRFAVLLLTPLYGRLALVIGIRLLPYGRGDEGLAAGLFDAKGRWAWVPGAVLAVGGSALLGVPAVLRLNGVFIGVLCLVLGWYRRRLGCVTGDMLGALAELTETALLLAMSAGF
jgi:adenosylcobinamide-GDP ribazoletransferase